MRFSTINEGGQEPASQPADDGRDSRRDHAPVPPSPTAAPADTDIHDKPHPPTPNMPNIKTDPALLALITSALAPPSPDDRVIDLILLADRDDGRQRTHWNGCEASHPECLARALAAALLRERERAERAEALAALRLEWYARACAERDALRADAERYRWICRNGQRALNLLWYRTADHRNNTLDAAIDAARKP